MSEALSLECSLRAGDERLPAVRARLFTLVRSLWRAGTLQLPLMLQGSDIPGLYWLHPLWQRLRVELLGEQLLRDILPAIERYLSSSGELLREEGGWSPAAPVDWAATWRRQLEQPGESPLITRRWQRTLQLPENLLAQRALRALAQNATTALRDLTHPAESQPLRQLSERARVRLVAPPWRGLDGSHEEVPRQAAHRIRHLLSDRPAYGALLAWWQQWEGWQQPAPGRQPLLDPELEVDWLFELLLLFELVALLAARLPVRQQRPLAANSRTPAFIARTSGGPLAVYYQSGAMFDRHRSLTGIWGVPDIVLQLPGDEPSYVVLDAKNYGPRAHTQAIYKMLGYLYQFGYDAEGAHRFHHIHAGVLVFPTEEREGKGLRNWQREHPGAQAVMSLVLPPLPDERYSGLAELVDWLLQKL